MATNVKTGPRGGVGVAVTGVGLGFLLLVKDWTIMRRTATRRTAAAILDYLKTMAGSMPVGKELPVRGRLGPRFA